jgi:hypothetical protein
MGACPWREFLSEAYREGSRANATERKLIYVVTACRSSARRWSAAGAGMWAGMLADLAAMSSSAPPPICPASLTAAAAGYDRFPI